MFIMAASNYYEMSAYLVTNDLVYYTYCEHIPALMEVTVEALLLVIM